MTTYGITDAGFVRKPIEVIQSEIEDELRELISPSLNLLPSGVLGQIVGVMTGALNDAWEAMEAIYSAAYPDSASGAALDGVMAITGATRLAADYSTVTILLFLDDGVTVPAGSIVSVGELGNQFETLTEVTNSDGYTKTFSVAAQAVETGEKQGLAYTIDTIVTPVSGWSQATAISSLNAETFSLSNGQTLTVEVDGGSEQTATFNTGDFADINNATAAEVAAVIDTDITGATASDEGGYVRIFNEDDTAGNSIKVTGGTANTALGFPTNTIQGFNQEDAELGRDEESDADARIRREELLQLAGSGTVDALRANVRNVDDVTNCTVFENTSMVTDGDGVPPKAFEVVVLGGDGDTIAETIWDHKPIGIESYGSSSSVVTDDQGFNHNVYYSRPSQLTMYVAITVDTDDDYPTDGDDQVKAALVAFGEDLDVGDDVYVAKMQASAFDVAGVIDVTVFKVDEANPPVNTSNYSVDTREIAVFDTSRIVVTTE